MHVCVENKLRFHFSVSLSHLPVSLQMLSDGDGLLNHVIQILRDFGGQSFRFQNAEDFGSRHEFHLKQKCGWKRMKISRDETGPEITSIYDRCLVDIIEIMSRHHWNFIEFWNLFGLSPEQRRANHEGWHRFARGSDLRERSRIRVWRNAADIIRTWLDPQIF